MNHIGVTRECGRCDRPSVVIIAGGHYCSSHGLDVTMDRIASRAIVVDLRSASDTVVDFAHDRVESRPCIDSMAG